MYACLFVCMYDMHVCCVCMYDTQVSSVMYVCMICMYVRYGMRACMYVSMLCMYAMRMYVCSVRTLCVAL